MRKENKTVFIADDGEIFDNEKACVEHENMVKEEAEKWSLWLVVHGPDLNEGRGHYGRTYVKASTKQHGNHYLAQKRVEDWCFRTIGRPVAFVQGVSVIENWEVYPLTPDEFANPREATVGDYRHGYTTVTLVNGEKEAGLVLQEVQSHECERIINSR